VFELAYLVFMVLILAVFGAAAGAIGEAVFGLPRLVGTVLLMVGIGAFTAYGNHAVERLFKWVSFFLYGVYVLFFLFVLTKFAGRPCTQVRDAGARRKAGCRAASPTPAYNIVGAVMILPLARHFLTRRDAVVAGVLAGPLAMLPGLLFFVCMVVWYPTIGAEGAALGLHAAAAGHADLPRAVPADDLQRAAREAVRPACMPRTNASPPLAHAARRGAVEPRALRDRRCVLVGSIFIAAASAWSNSSRGAIARWPGCSWWSTCCRC
jgi:hypothetical protein